MGRERRRGRGREDRREGGGERRKRERVREGEVGGGVRCMEKVVISISTNSLALGLITHIFQ